MLTGNHHGERLGACTDCRRFWARYRAGEIDEHEINDVNAKLCPTAGTCMVMGTASTMALCSEALGMMLPGGAAIPAVLAERMRNAEATGARAVAHRKRAPHAGQDHDARTQSRTRLRVLLAIGGSTNAIVHLTAVAGRLGIALDLDAFDRMGRDDAGAGRSEADRPALHGGSLQRGRPRHHPARIEAAAASRRAHGHRQDAAAKSSKPCGRRAARTSCITLTDPIFREGGIAVLRGNLAPDGAIIKQSAASEKLMQHTGRAVVFESLEDLALRIDDAALDVRADDILVLKNAGPEGRARHARGRLHTDPAQARASRRERHGAHFRRAHERHRVRLHRAARDARVGDRRTARAREERRSHRARCARSDASSCWWTKRELERAAQRGGRPPRAKRTSADIASSSCEPCNRRIEAAISIFLQPRLQCAYRAASDRT